MEGTARRGGVWCTAHCSVAVEHVWFVQESSRVAPLGQAVKF